MDHALSQCLVYKEYLIYLFVNGLSLKILFNFYFPFKLSLNKFNLVYLFYPIREPQISLHYSRHVRGHTFLIITN